MHLAAEVPWETMIFCCRAPEQIPTIACVVWWLECEIVQVHYGDFTSEYGDFTSEYGDFTSE